MKLLKLTCVVIQSENTLKIHKTYSKSSCGCQNFSVKNTAAIICFMDLSCIYNNTFYCTLFVKNITLTDIMLIYQPTEIIKSLKH